MVRRSVTILEEGRPVVSHTFHGRDAAEAKHYERSHRKSDRFLDAALAGRPFKGIHLTVRRGRRHGRR